MLEKSLRRIYHACWYVFATIVLSSAIVITLIRILLPHAGEYREQLQNLITRQTGYTVVIDNIRGEWEGWIPILNLDGIHIATGSGEGNITRLKSASIRFDPITSFRQGQFTPFHLTIIGPELTIIRGSNGSYSMATEEAHAAVPESAVSDAAFTDWLLLQKTISISDAKVTILDARNEFNPVILSSVDLLLKNSISHMQLNGSMVLPEAYGELCSFALDIYGDISTPDWSGQIYMEALHAHPAAWLSHMEAHAPITLNNAPANIRLWSTWQKAQLTRINGVFEATGLRLAQGASQLDIQHVSSLFTLARDPEQGFRLTVKVKELRTGNGAWPETETSVITQPRTDGNHSRLIVHSDYVNIKDVMAIAGGYATAVHPFLSGTMNVSGSLQDCLMVYDPALPAAERFAFDSRIRELNVQDTVYNLDIQHLQGSLAGTASHGQLRLDTPASAIILPGVLNKTIVSNELQGDIQWFAEKDALRLETAHMQAHTPHFNAELKGSILFTAGDKLPYVDMLFSAGELDLENLQYYMPAALPERARAWIRQALVAGDVSTLDVALKGQLADLPFDHGEGRFEVIAAIHNATLDYHPDWVPVDNIEAELRLDGRTLTVDANAGNIYNAVFTHALATIDDINADTNAVSIQLEIKGQVHDALKFINNTPLSASHLLSEVTRHDIDGPFKLDLGLHIPFHDMPISYNGNIHFDDATLKSTTFGIDLDHITGVVAFGENTVLTDNLTASYLGEPVNLIIKSAHQSSLIFGLTGTSGGSFIAGQLAHFSPGLDKLTTQLEKHLDGSCTWTAILSPLTDTTDPLAAGSNTLHITSTLSGLAINLPAPLGKTSDAVPLDITTVISPSPRRHIEFTYGDSLAGTIDLDRSNADILSRIEVTLGADEKPSGEGNGIIIHGAINDLSLSDWYGFLHSLDENPGVGPTENVQIDIAAGSLDLLGQRYKDMRFRLLHEPSDWHVSLNGSDIDGDVHIPGNMKPGTVQGAFARLKFSRTEEPHSTTDMVPASLPPLHFTVDEFTYGDFKLGKLELVTTPVANGMSVDMLAFTKPEVQITGTGKWTSGKSNPVSEFEMDLHAASLAAMLTTFNYSQEPIKDGVSRFKLNAQWPGSPMDFSLAGITGTLNLEIDKGQFLDIEPKAGRLFGLLNLQTLIRLLSLDFTVLFSKGYVFDKIEGSFTIESGNAYTNNLAVKGHSADINVTGRTGLIDKDYDQIATVIPHTLFGPIGAGLGAVINIAGEVFATIPEKIDKLLRYQYTIKGSWEAPVIEKYNSEY